MADLPLNIQPNDAVAIDEKQGAVLCPGPGSARHENHVLASLDDPREGYSQQRACALVGLHAKTYRYASKRLEELRARLRGLPLSAGGSAIVALACCWLARAFGLTTRSSISFTRKNGCPCASAVAANGLWARERRCDPAGPEPALVNRLRHGHAGDRSAIPHPHGGR